MRRYLLALTAVLLVAGCDSGDDEPARVRVMSQNVYLGGDLFTVSSETNPRLVPVRVAQLYDTIEKSDPAARMAAIAAEIARVNPDLVGLQEVSTYWTQSPADNLPGMTPTQATNLTYDFLDLLTDALAAEGASYLVVSQSNNTEVEFPATFDGQTFFDVRYRDADVILARSDVSTGTPTEAAFQALLKIPIGGVEQTFTRAYQYIPATVDGVDLTFVNTHFEVGGPAEPVQILQSQQLRTVVANLSSPVVVVGDVNSDGNKGGTSYATLTADLKDASAVGSAETCCQAADLRNTTSQLASRIDVVLFRGFGRVAEAKAVLNDPSDRVGGIWPSDHAGVWAELVAGGDDV